jgi:putative membrane protein
MQGLVPAIIAREIIIRLDVLRRKNWIPFLVVSICLAISACYELLEWWAALIGGNAANDFLGTQGDIWDTQSDMFLALTGAVCALLFLSYFHDRALCKLQSSPGTAE